MSPQKRLPSDLKHRVIACLNKLSDRDTLAVATIELESIAKALTHDSFSSFLTCLSTTDSSEKSPVRKQCVRLLGFISAEHRNALSPHLSKMISAVLHRLREPDSSVRVACVDAVSSMASHITKPPFSSFMKPLVDAILVEQDYNVQIGSALCLAAAIDSSPDPEPAQLQKLLPRFSKLVKNDSFKAKPALLSLIGSVACAGGASNRNVLSYVIPCLVEFLSSEDWTARKASAEALARLAMAERDRLTEFKSSCLASFETKRFDKVKVVREMMNRAFELWKEVPGDSKELPSPSQSNSSMKDSGNGRSSSTVSKGSHDKNGLATPQPKKKISTRKSPTCISSSMSEKRSPQKSSHRKPSPAISLKAKNPSDWTVEIAAPLPTTLKHACKDSDRSKGIVVPDSENGGEHSCALFPETKRVLFNDSPAENSKVIGSRFVSRVVPFHENDNCKLDMAESKASEDVYMNQKEAENLSLIEKQLLQIENQQSNLLDLLQKFIGSSQSGISSLETRVNGLEKALGEISYDLALSNGKIKPQSTESGGNTCCMLPGTEFLRPKYWRRTEGHFSTSRFSSPYNTPANFGDREVFSPRAQLHNGVAQRDSRGNLEPYSYKTPRKLLNDAEMVHVSHFGNRIQNQT